MQTIEELRRFQDDGTFSFTLTDKGLVKLKVHNTHADAEIYLHGAQLTHFQPKGAAALIFDATETEVTPPKAVHAGVPICWPWFGAHPENPQMPQHGFARDRVWHLQSIKTDSSGKTEVILRLKDDDTTLPLFPYHFVLELKVTIAESLTLSLTTTNRDLKPFTLTQALHTYLAVGDIEAITIEGLEGTPYIDYTDDKRQKSTAGALTLHSETNRVYLPTSATCKVIDHTLRRMIIIEKEGSDSTTVWNPWRESGIHDLPDDKYRRFVCIETTNALSDKKVVHPRQSTTILQRLSLKAL